VASTAVTTAVISEAIRAVILASVHYVGIIEQPRRICVRPRIALVALVRKTVRHRAASGGEQFVQLLVRAFVR
jgi:hypothetical protein